MKKSEIQKQAAYDEKVLAIECPTCKARPKQRCLIGTNRNHGPHIKRYRRAHNITVERTQPYTPEILAVPCPYCPAQAGQRCRATRGHSRSSISQPHASRAALATPTDPKVINLAEVIDNVRLATSIKEYVSSLEINPTDDVCKCDWLYRDTDTEGKPTSGVRVRSGVNMNCPAHTKEGFLRGFFVHLGLVEDTSDDSAMAYTA